VQIDEAVMSWYDDIYQPIVQIARQRGVLQRFPDRSEADVYLWVMAHREDLMEREEHDVAPVDAVQHLANEIDESESGFSWNAIRRAIGRFLGHSAGGRTS
jgi:hypothetical protein